MTVSVVVPCLNEVRHIERLLDAVRLQDCSLHEVIVADCGSRDGTLPLLQKYKARYPGLPLSLLVQPNATIPIALNAAIAAATGEVIIRLDAHSCPSHTYVRLLVTTLRETGAGVAGGVWSIAPGADTATARAIRRAAAHPLGAGDAAYRITSRQTKRMVVDTVPYGCYRRATWEKVGRYNEELQTNEDYEFNYRIRLAGLQVVLDPAIRCTYFARSTLGQLAAQYFRYGWWKARMLKQYPRSIRLRQAIPVGFVTALIGLGGASLFLDTARWGLLGLVLIYALAVGTVSTRIGAASGDWKMAALLPAVFATIHFSWGLGMLTNLATCGLWPRMKANREER